jgi:rare lipoprotein A
MVSIPTPRVPADTAANPCAPTRKHLDSDYTPGGLYAPGVSDGGPAAPIDVSAVLEPVPRAEPRSRYGNRSPYTVLGKSYRVLDSADGYSERGVASWYGTKFNGRATSSGELYDICVFTAAHKTLPLPSFVRVTNLDNGRSLVVRVNDRGPFHSGRIMDLSYAAAVRLGVDRTGTARVELRSIGSDGDLAPPPRFADVGARVPAAAHLDGERSVATDIASLPDAGDKLVQVGSFGEKSNATRLADRLQDAGVDDVDVDHAEVGGNDVWRVRIGPVDVEKLARLLEHLRQLDLPNPRVFSE